VRAFCESRGEDVWLREGGMLAVSAGESEDSGVERAFEAVSALGVEEEATLLDTEEVRRRCDSPRFCSGVIFRDGATVQPARLVLVLRRAAIASGVLGSSTLPSRLSGRARRPCSRRPPAWSRPARSCSL
jgi:glycine/D-amino acid oxidase-like deaminating enzyme